MHCRKLAGYHFLDVWGAKIGRFCAHIIEIFRQRDASNLHHTHVATGVVGLATGTGNALGNIPDSLLVRHDTERYKEGVRDFTLMHARLRSTDHFSTPAVRRASTRLLFALFVAILLLAGSARSALAQDAGPQAASDPQALPTLPLAALLPKDQAKSAPGTICGSIIDVTGAPIVGAKITLTRDDQSTDEQLSDENGRFTFSNVKPGEFQLTIASQGFTSQGTSGLLHGGENYSVPQVALTLATSITEIHVNMSRMEIAESEIKEQEKQRVLGFVPNFYVSYVSDAAPLSAKQKFELAWKTTIDPVNFALTGVIAGIEQSQDAFEGYGQGAQGYAKRFGAAYADGASATFIGGAILPTVFKQDPRYFYKGTGSKRSRVLYALANSVICKGDNGKWQPAYSSILGSLAAGGLSNLYYAPSDRNGAELTFENALVGIGASAVTNLLQEFVVRRLTPHAMNNPPISAAP